MRFEKTLICAALLTAAAPLAAQGTAANTVDANVAANETAVDTGNVVSTTDAATAPTNGLTAGPGTEPLATEPVAADAETAAPADEDGFPWGLLGLLGLIGLIPRGRRS